MLCEKKKMTIPLMKKRLLYTFNNRRNLRHHLTVLLDL